MINTVPQANPAVAIGVLEGIEAGWPGSETPTFTAEQRSALQAAAKGASGELAEAYRKVATRWTQSEIFGLPPAPPAETPAAGGRGGRGRGAGAPPPAAAGQSQTPPPAGRGGSTPPPPAAAR